MQTEHSSFPRKKKPFKYTRNVNCQLQNYGKTTQPLIRFMREINPNYAVSVRIEHIPSATAIDHFYSICFLRKRKRELFVNNYEPLHNQIWSVKAITGQIYVATSPNCAVS